MISKDLISFVEREKPEVLYKNSLEYDRYCSGFNLSGQYRTHAEAAALLEHWLIEELRAHQLSINVYGEPAYSETMCWHVSVSDPSADDYDHPKLYYTDKKLLSALWQAYKSVKGE